MGASMDGFEIHCPMCGYLLRSKKEAKPSEGCPDCKDHQAIFLPVYAGITPTTGEQILAQQKEKERCQRRLNKLLDSADS